MVRRQLVNGRRWMGSFFPNISFLSVVAVKNVIIKLNQTYVFFRVSWHENVSLTIVIMMKRSRIECVYGLFVYCARKSGILSLARF